MARIILFFCCLIWLSSCRELVNRQTVSPPVTSADMKTLTTPPKPIIQKTKRKSLAQNIPTIPTHFTQPVSISITENLSLKPLFIELARQADVDLQLDPKINSHIVFSANKRPFIEVIKDMCELAGLKYKIINNSLRIESDNFYTETYNVQFLNLSRNSQNHVSIATDVFSGVNTQKNVIDNGSNSAITVNSINDFWNELEGNLKIILSQTANNNSNGATSQANYSIHKQAGIISILGNSHHHLLVSNYLNALRLAASSQVLIEAKIIEVILNDEFRSGINWQKISTRGDLRTNAPLGHMSRRSRFLEPHTAQNEMISLGATGKSFSAILEALQEFGASRTLSSPRLTVMNNQTAILKVAQNEVYFRLNYDKQYNTAVQRENVTVSSDIQTVPIGLVMSVQPSIDPQTGEVILFLRPTISRLSRSVQDPAVNIAYNMNNTTGDATQAKPSLIPVVEVREIDSVLRVISGEIAVLGGLMEVRSIQDTSKLPVVGDIPYIKELFSAYTDGDQVIELVILLKATIQTQDGVINAADNRLMTSYVSDPRPFVIAN